MKALPVLLLLIIASPLFAQQTEIKLDWLANVNTYYNGGTMMVNDIAIGSDGAIVAVGYFSNTVDFDPGSDTFTVSSTGKQDIFIAKYNKTGKLVYAYGFGGKGNPLFEQAYSVALDNDGNAYMAGNFSNTIDFDPGTGTALLTSTSTEAFIASYDKNGVFRYVVQATTTGATVRVQVAKSIIVDSRHNVYIAGSFTGTVDFDPGVNKAYLSAAGGLDIFFAKYDSNGKYVWAKRIGNSEDDEGNRIVFDKSNHLVLSGYFSYYTDFNPGRDTAFLVNNGKKDIFFAKFDTSGNYVFAKSIGGPQDDVAASVAAGTDNSIAITGSFASRNVDFDPGNGSFLLSDEGGGDGFVAKYDSSGNFAFAFKIGSTFRNDACADIDVDSSNNLIVVGTFAGNVDFDPGPGVYNMPVIHDYDNFTAKYTAAGSFVFANGTGNSNYTKWHTYTYLNCVETAKDGSIITGGSFSDTLDVDPGTAVKNVFEPAITILLTKYNSSGNYNSSINANNYFEYYNNTAYVQASVTDAEGNVYTSGAFNGRFDFDPGPGVYVLESLADYGSSTYFAKYDKNGRIIFAKGITYGIELADLVVDKNQNIYLCGQGFSSSDFDPSDTAVAHWNGDTSHTINYGYCFVKYNKTGDLVFVKGFYNNLEGNQAKSIAVDEAGNIYVGGNFSHSIDFDPGTATHSLRSIGYDIFYSKYDSSGNYIYAYNIGAIDKYNYVNKIKINSEGNLILCGNFSGNNIDFNPGPKQFLLSSGVNAGGYIAAYKSNGQFLRTIAITSTSKDYYQLYLNDFDIDASDNMYIGGYVLGSIDFDPGNRKMYLPVERGLYFASYTKAGALRFAKGSYNFSPETATISALAVDKNKNIYTAGSFRAQQIDVDFGPDSAILVNEHYIDSYTSNWDVFLARYDSLGNYLYSYDFDGDSALGNNFISAINVGRNGDLSIAGYGQTKIDFDPGPGSVFLQPTTLYSSIFVAKYSQFVATAANNTRYADGTPILQENKSNLSLYPNPAKAYVVVNRLPANDKTTIVVTDVSGKTVALYNTNAASQYKCDVSKLTAGIYYLHIQTTTKTEALQFVKE